MKMIGKTTKFACGCCFDDTKVRSKRAAKRREKQAWKKSV